MELKSEFVHISKSGKAIDEFGGTMEYGKVLIFFNAKIS